LIYNKYFDPFWKWLTNEKRFLATKTQRHEGAQRERKQANGQKQPCLEGVKPVAGQVKAVVQKTVYFAGRRLPANLTII
jgi:hypothetical protein